MLKEDKAPLKLLHVFHFTLLPAQGLLSILSKHNLFGSFI